MNATDLLIDWTVRSSLLLGAVTILALLGRRWSASRRHALWALGMIGVLAVPLLSRTLPTWGIFPTPTQQPASVGETILAEVSSLPVTDPLALGTSIPVMSSQIALSWSDALFLALRQVGWMVSPTSGG
ncbi:MAG: hypothetical protein ACI957_003634 [Verrucomicrobiales bacterium]|jgi:hypothetical protein